MYSFRPPSQDTNLLHTTYLMHGTVRGMPGRPLDLSDLEFSSLPVPSRRNPRAHPLAIQVCDCNEKVPFAHNVVQGGFVHFPIESCGQRRGCEEHLRVGKTVDIRY